jgi:hypothetical protein
MDFITILILGVIGLLVFLMFRADKSSDGKLDLKLGFAKQSEFEVLKKEVADLKENPSTGLTSDQVVQLIRSNILPIQEDMQTLLKADGFTVEEIRTSIAICQYIANKAASDPNMPKFAKVTIRRRSNT